MKTILCLDQQADVARAVLYDRHAHALAIEERATPIARPTRDREEQDPIGLARAMLDAATDAIEVAGDDGKALAAIGISVPRDAIVVWDPATGEPVAPAIVGRDIRSISACRALIDADFASSIRFRAGLTIDARFAAPRLAWLLDQDARLRTRAENGKLAFGTLDSWLIWTLTGGQEHLMGIVNAAGTSLYDFDRQRWDERLARIFGVPAAMLPTVVPTGGLVATIATRDTPLDHVATALRDPLRRFIASARPRTPILAVSTERGAAFVGQRCLAPASVAATFDAGRTSVIYNTGAAALRSRSGLWSSVAWHRPMPKDEEDDPFGDEFLLPEFPVETWDSSRGGWITTTEVVVFKYPVVLPQDRSFAFWFEGCLESVASDDERALAVCDVVARMETDMAMKVSALHADGPGAADDHAMQAQADALGVPVVRPASSFTSAIGIAMLAGTAAGIWETIEAAAARVAALGVRVFEPAGDEAARKERVLAWRSVRSCGASRAGTTTD